VEFFFISRIPHFLKVGVSFQLLIPEAKELQDSGRPSREEITSSFFGTSSSMDCSSSLILDILTKYDDTISYFVIFIVLSSFLRLAIWPMFLTINNLERDSYISFAQFILDMQGMKFFFTPYKIKLMDEILDSLYFSFPVSSIGSLTFPWTKSKTLCLARIRSILFFHAL